MQTPPSELQTHASERSTSCTVDHDEFGELFQVLGLHKSDENWQKPADWLREDISDPGYQLLADELQSIMTTLLIVTQNREDISDPGYQLLVDEFQSIMITLLIVTQNLRMKMHLNIL